MRALPALLTVLVLAACAAPQPQAAAGANEPGMPAQKPATKKDRIFQVRDLGVRTATIVLRATGKDAAHDRGEEFYVDAGLNGDIKLAVVREVIRLIRRDYDGDFDWNSSRLKRILKLSARRKDTAELEAFLTLELFGERKVDAPK